MITTKGKPTIVAVLAPSKVTRTQVGNNIKLLSGQLLVFAQCHSHKPLYAIMMEKTKTNPTIHLFTIIFVHFANSF